jgi:hypothetical protein
MGASKRQIYTRVVVPAILPGLFMVLRMNLFAAWIVVLMPKPPVSAWVGPGHHVGAQHVQSVTGVLHHRADRRVRVQLRFRAPAGAAGLLYWVPREVMSGL